jgi:hypothetical protein
MVNAVTGVLGSSSWGVIAWMFTGVYYYLRTYRHQYALAQVINNLNVINIVSDIIDFSVQFCTKLRLVVPYYYFNKKIGFNSGSEFIKKVEPC